RVSPADAAAIAGLTAEGGRQAGDARVQLSTLLGRPAYRVDGAIVFADTGEPLAQASLEQSRAIASRFLGVPEERMAHAGTLTSGDQWTLQARPPLHKFRIDDPGATETYVQPRTGDIATVTTRRSRMLAWMGVIPHWFYFTALRQHQSIWYHLVVWTAGAACILAALGLILAVTQF